MFWKEPFDVAAQVARCKQTWNVCAHVYTKHTPPTRAYTLNDFLKNKVNTPVNWIPETYGGYDGLRAASNIYFRYRAHIHAHAHARRSRTLTRAHARRSRTLIRAHARAQKTYTYKRHTTD